MMRATRYFIHRANDLGPISGHDEAENGKLKGKKHKRHRRPISSAEREDGYSMSLSEDSEDPTADMTPKQKKKYLKKLAKKRR